MPGPSPKRARRSRNQGQSSRPTRQVRPERLERLEPRALLSVAMVQDINQVDATPNELTLVGQTLYFVANDPIPGKPSLYQSDGTPNGTKVVTPINNLNNPYLTNVNGTLYFVATDAKQNQEIFSTKPGSSGVVEVSNLDPGQGGISFPTVPAQLTGLGSNVFFTADDGTDGTQLFVSNGSAGNTLMLTSGNVTGGGLNPTDLTVSNGKLFFVANDGTHGTQLYVSDGTKLGTVPISSFGTGASTVRLSNLTDVNGLLYFEVVDPNINGGFTGQLWKSDGTKAGTVPLNPGGAGYDVLGGLTNVNGTLDLVATQYQLVSGKPTFSPAQIDKIDSTTGNATAITNFTFFASPANLTNANGNLFFTINDGTHGNELWETNGTAAGSKLVADINTGPASSILPNPSLDPSHRPTPQLTAIGGTVYFSADDGVHGQELWKSDGTASGTVLVDEINPGPASSSPQDLVVGPGNTLVFVAHDGTGSNQVYKSDGTSGGTTVVASFSPAQTLGSNPSKLTAVGSALFFTADDGVHGQELYLSDGTTAGTKLAADLSPGPDGSSLNNLVAFKGGLYFFASGADLTPGIYTSDTTGKVVPFETTPNIEPSSLTASANALYYTIPTGSPQVLDLYQSLGGIPNDATKVATISSAPNSVGSFHGLGSIGSTLFFTVLDSSMNVELWRTGGTASNTLELSSFSQAQFLANQAVVANGLLFFVVGDGGTGQALWKSDGTVANTTLVKDFTASNGIRDLVASNGMAYFSANDGTNGTQLWTSDGTLAGTKMLTMGNSTSGGIAPSQLTDVNGTLFFVGEDPAQNNALALWESGGTSASTTIVRDFPSANSTYTTLGYLLDVNGTLYFTAEEIGSAGVTSTLWKSDGKASGTRPLQGTLPSGFLSNATAVNGIVFFTANDSLHGTELWSASNLSIAPPAISTIANQHVNQGGTVNVAVQATDPDSSQTLKYSLGSVPPQGATINPSTGAFSWAVPANQAPGAYTISVVVTDSGSPSTSAMTQFVVSVIGPPILSNTPDQTAYRDTQLTFSVGATGSVAGDSLSYSLLPGAPSGVSINPGTGAVTWSVPASQALGDYPIKVKVTDTTASPPLSSTETITVHVKVKPLDDFNGDGISDVGVYLPDMNLFALNFLKVPAGPQSQNVFSYGYHTAGTFAVPLVGDFNGDGVTDVGVYLPDKDLFALDYLNAQGQSIGQAVFNYGYHTAGTFAVPLVGDFNGDGVTDVGVYLPDKDLFALDYLNAQGQSIGQAVFNYGFHTGGTPAVPITGDFNGDGTTDVGIYQPNNDFFALDYLSANALSVGQAGFNYGFHTEGIFASPITGDFNGDGTTDVGIYQPNNDFFALDDLGSSGMSVGQNVFRYGFHNGGTFAMPLVGDFNGDGTTDIGIYQPDKDFFALNDLGPNGQSIGQNLFNYGYHTAGISAIPLAGGSTLLPSQVLMATGAATIQARSFGASPTIPAQTVVASPTATDAVATATDPTLAPHHAKWAARHRKLAWLEALDRLAAE